MGMDLVELVIEVEEAFGITIEDRDAEQVRTIGQLHRYVVGKLGGRAASPCPTASGFYRLRRALVDGWAVDRMAVRPGTRLDDLLPIGPRHATWGELGATAGVKLPRLVLPRWCGWAAGGAYLASVAGSVALGRNLRGTWAEALMLAGVGALGLLVAVLVAMDRLQAWFGVRLPAGFATVGDLARLVGTREYAHLDTARESRDAWERLVAIVAEQAGVRPDRLHADTDFVDDLFLD